MSAASSAAPRRLSRAVKAAASHTGRMARRSGAPPGVLSIPASPRLSGVCELLTPLTPDDHATAGAAVRQYGCVRRVFLLNPYLTGDELAGLAHYIKVMGRNAGISAVLVATNDDDDKATLATPTPLVDIDRTDKLSPVDVGQFGPGEGRAWHVSGGYDPLELYEKGALSDPAALGAVLDGVRDVALACRGGIELDEPTGETVAKSKVPVISVPHGLLHDGGSAFLMSSYVLATKDTCFRIMNPSRGLSLDPTGLSFVLPRSGWEYDQPSARYSSSIATLIGLCGYEANAEDLVETGLATHMLGEAHRLGRLEHSLGNLDAWKYQVVRRKKVHTYDERHEMWERNQGYPEDVNNAPHKNKSVASVVYATCQYDAAGEDNAIGPPEGYVGMEEEDEGDPSLNLEGTGLPLWFDRGSYMVDLAATFDAILKSSRTADILEGLKEVAASHLDSSDTDERECGEVARGLAEDMERQSPLALRVVHRLLQLGSARKETLEGCMEREGRAQRNMYMQDDFKFWADAVSNGKVEEIGEFRGWKHRNLRDVTDDEVEEIIGAE